MDVATYRKLQDSGWIRLQRDRLADGDAPGCPIETCGGRLEPYDALEFAAVGDGLPRPGGVRCSACGARSRAVAL